MSPARKERVFYLYVSPLTSEMLSSDSVFYKVTGEESARIRATSSASNTLLPPMTSTIPTSS